MAKAVVLKNPNNEDIFPVTDASLVSGTLDPTAIADSSVTSSKLDWSTMPAPILVYMPAHVTKSISAAWTTAEFYTTNVNFPAGKYLVIFTGCVGGTSTNGEHWTRLGLDAIEGSQYTGNEWQFGQGAIQTVTSATVWDITAGTHAVKFGAGAEITGNITMYGGNNGSQSKAWFIKIG